MKKGLVWQPYQHGLPDLIQIEIACRECGELEPVSVMPKYEQQYRASWLCGVCASAHDDEDEDDYDDYDYDEE